MNSHTKFKPNPEFWLEVKAFWERVQDSPVLSGALEGEAWDDLSWDVRQEVASLYRAALGSERQLDDLGHRIWVNGLVRMVMADDFSIEFGEVMDRLEGLGMEEGLVDGCFELIQDSGLVDVDENGGISLRQ